MSFLPSSSASSRIAPPSRRCRRAADQLDERHHRHRAEEVHPDEPRAPRRRATASARRSIEIELVFEAKIAAPARARRAPPELPLDLEVLEHGLDDEVGRRRAPCRRWRGPGRASRRAPSASACPWRPRDRGCRRSVRDPPGPARGPARTDDVLPDRGVDLGDAVAHEPGAGHEHALQRHDVRVPGEPRSAGTGRRRRTDEGMVRDRPQGLVRRPRRSCDVSAPRSVTEIAQTRAPARARRASIPK